MCITRRSTPGPALSAWGVSPSASGYIARQGSVHAHLSQSCALVCTYGCMGLYQRTCGTCTHAFICLLMIVYAGDSVRSWSPPSSATNAMNANGNSDGGITMMENPAYATQMDGIKMMENPVYATQMDGIKMMENPAYATQMDGITIMENPAYVSHVYVQINPTLPTRPRPITPGHPITHNTSDSTSYPDYI